VSVEYEMTAFDEVPDKVVLHNAMERGDP